MEGFYLHVKSNGKWIQYPEQDGLTSLALMEFMLQRGVESKAIAKRNGVVEIFNITELREVVESCA